MYSPMAPTDKIATRQHKTMLGSLFEVYINKPERYVATCTDGDKRNTSINQHCLITFRSSVQLKDQPKSLRVFGQGYPGEDMYIYHCVCLYAAASKNDTEDIYPSLDFSSINRIVDGHFFNFTVVELLRDYVNKASKPLSHTSTISIVS